MTIFYHGTPVRNAELIDREGFRDGACSALIDGERRRGVWISTDSVVMHVANETALYAIEIEIEPDPIAEYKVNEAPEIHGYQRWLVPANVLNRFPRKRIK